MPPLSHILWVAAGGALGALLRYGAGLLIAGIWRDPFPLATWLVNMIGCLLIGFAIPYAQQQADGSFVRLFFIAGFLGAFTTFSAYSMETLALWQHGFPALAVLNALGSVIVGLIGVCLGLLAAYALAS